MADFGDKVRVEASDAIGGAADKVRAHPPAPSIRKPQKDGRDSRDGVCEIGDKDMRELRDIARGAGGTIIRDRYPSRDGTRQDWLLVQLYRPESPGEEKKLLKQFRQALDDAKDCIGKIGIQWEDRDQNSAPKTNHECHTGCGPADITAPTTPDLSRNHSTDRHR